MTTHPASDIPRAGWLATWLPPGLLPYARLMRADRPIGTWLLLFPCWWGIALATPGLPSVWLIAIFAAGAFVMRGAGCTYNDIVDRDFDGRVARTADRPIPSGAVTLRGAVAFLLAQLLAGGHAPGVHRWLRRHDQAVPASMPPTRPRGQDGRP